MRLTVVGCSGSFPGPDSAASCYLLEAPFEGRTFRLVLDLGSGALGALQRHVDLRSVDAVALSHLHADHCLDLCGFYVVRKYHPAGHLGRIPVYGPPGTAARLARAYDLDEHVGMRGEFTFETYPDESFTIGPFEVQVARVDHPVPAYALRVSAAGRALVYSGDTGPCAALDEIADGCDLLLAEASFVEGGDNPEHLHLTGADAGRVADKAGVGRLVLTHVPPWHDPQVALSEARAHYPGDVEVAAPGAGYDV
jgi:ribonuclease BN (tRNA processing enzyme)